MFGARVYFGTLRGMNSPPRVGFRARGFVPKPLSKQASKNARAARAFFTVLKKRERAKERNAVVLETYSAPQIPWLWGGAIRLLVLLCCKERGRAAPEGERERKRERERAPRRSHPQPWRKKEGESERPCRSKKRQPSPATTLCNFQLHRPRCSSRSRCDVRRGVGPVSEFQGRDTQWGWRRGK